MEQSASSSPPLPKPLRGADIGSFAHHSVVRRLPNIARRVLAENRFAQAVAALINELIAEIPGGRIRPLKDAAAPDAASWQRYVDPYRESNWLDVPWFFAETYFYRRILEATGYFGPGPGEGLDPYAHQKRTGLETGVPLARSLSAQLNQWLAQGWNETTFATLLATDLWANQMDLSLWPAGAGDQPSHAGLEQQQAHLLVDDSKAVFIRLAGAEQPALVSFLIDNAGFELVCDLLLADYLLNCGAAATVRFHLKIHPTFVSDATPGDVEQTVDFLAGVEDESIAALAGRLESYLASDRLLLRQHPFWTSPLAGWDMPEDEYRELADSQLVVSKGDANYRRLLGDRHWPFTSSFGDILSYFPAPVVALRSLKSEVAAGLDTGRVEALRSSSPRWMIGGNFGVIQYASGRHGS